MKVKDLMKLFVIPEQNFKIWVDNYSQTYTKAHIVLDEDLMGRDIDFIYTIPQSDCISIVLLNY